MKDIIITKITKKNWTSNLKNFILVSVELIKVIIFWKIYSFFF